MTKIKLKQYITETVTIELPFFYFLEEDDGFTFGRLSNESDFIQNLEIAVTEYEDEPLSVNLNITYYESIVYLEKKYFDSPTIESQFKEEYEKALFYIKSKL